MPSKKPPADVPGVIDADHSYTRLEFMARTGIGEESFSKALRNGLSVAKIHGRTFISGAAWIEYLKKAPRHPIPEEEPPPPPPPVAPTVDKKTLHRRSPFRPGVIACCGECGSEVLVLYGTKSRTEFFLQKPSA